MRSRETRPAPPGTVQAHGLRRWWLNLSLRAKGLMVVAVPLIALMGDISANLVPGCRPRPEPDSAFSISKTTRPTSR